MYMSAKVAILQEEVQLFHRVLEIMLQAIKAAFIIMQDIQLEGQHKKLLELLTHQTMLILTLNL